MSSRTLSVNAFHQGQRTAPHTAPERDHFQPRIPSRRREPSATPAEPIGKIADPPSTRPFTVPLDCLIPDPDNERKTLREIEALMDHLRGNGLIEPLIVTRAQPMARSRQSGGGESYMVLSGHRRLEAARRLGWDQIEVIVRDADHDPNARARIRLSANMQRETLDALELAEGLQRMMMRDPSIRTQADLARVLHRSEPWVSERLRVVSLPTPVLEKVRTSELSISPDAMARVAREKDPELQLALCDDLLNGASTREIRHAIAEARPARERNEDRYQQPAEACPVEYRFECDRQPIHVKLCSPDELTTPEQVQCLQIALAQAKRKAKGDRSRAGVRHG